MIFFPSRGAKKKKTHTNKNGTEPLHLWGALISYSLQPSFGYAQPHYRSLSTSIPSPSPNPPKTVPEMLAGVW